MKFFKISCLITFTLMTLAEIAHSQDIFSIVNNDTVTLWETGAYRNCGALYDMEINLTDHLIEWYQVDTGLSANCSCTFDLSVTLGPLEAGTYNVNVYYTESFSEDTLFEGTTSFIIGTDRNIVTSGIISQYQSDCYTGIKDQNSDRIGFSIFPVPVRDGEYLNIEVIPDGKYSLLEILTITGEVVYSKEYNGNLTIRDQWMKEKMFPVPGLYVVRLISDDQVLIRKILVL